jgi:hypothetical protein
VERTECDSDQESRKESERRMHKVQGKKPTPSSGRLLLNNWRKPSCELYPSCSRAKRSNRRPNVGQDGSELPQESRESWMQESCFALDQHGCSWIPNRGLCSRHFGDSLSFSPFLQEPSSHSHPLPRSIHLQQRLSLDPCVNSVSLSFVKTLLRSTSHSSQPSLGLHLLILFHLFHLVFCSQLKKCWWMFGVFIIFVFWCVGGFFGQQVMKGREENKRFCVWLLKKEKKRKGKESWFRTRVWKSDEPRGP